MTKRPTRAGFTLIELLTVITLIGITSLFLLPRLRVTPRTHVRNAAELLVRDLELMRTRAMATKSAVRVDFFPGAGKQNTVFADFMALAVRGVFNRALGPPNRLTQHQGGPRWRVLFILVVNIGDLDMEGIAQITRKTL